MATAENKALDEKDVASPAKKARRSILRSMSWKRSKKNKMEENGDETMNDSTVGEKSFDTNEMSDDECENEADLDRTGSSKKRKRFAVWKSMKKMFRRKSNKSSKSFTEGDSQSPQSHPPARSISDPNLISRPERPELAPLQQVEDTSLNTEDSTSIPKKAKSHDSLLSELRGKSSKPMEYEATVTVNHQSQGIDWQVSPSTEHEQFVPGLRASHDKIRVAPRDRRAPSRKHASGSVRQAGLVVKDIMPRSNSEGDSSKTKVDTKKKLEPLKEEKAEVKMEEEIKGKSNEETKEEKRNKEETSEMILDGSTGEVAKNDVNIDQKEEEKQITGVNEELTESLTLPKAEKITSVDDEIEIKEIDNSAQNVTQEKTSEKEECSASMNQQGGIVMQENDEKILPVEVNTVHFTAEEEKVKKEDDQATLEEVLEEPKELSVTSPSLEIEVGIVEKTTERDSSLSKGVISSGSPETLAAPSLKISDDIPDLQPNVTPPEHPPAQPTVEAQSSIGVVEAQPTVVVKTASDAGQKDALRTTPEHLPKTDLAPSEITEKKVEESISSVPPSDESMVVVALSKKENSEEPPTVDNSQPATVPPAKSKRLTIESPDEVYQKAIMTQLKTKENDEKISNEPDKVERRPVSLHEETTSSQDDSMVGVANLKQAFERSHPRANTISYSPRRKKPEVKPKPRTIPSDKSKSLGRNHRFPVTTSNATEKALETTPENVAKETSSTKTDIITVNNPTTKPEKPVVANRPKPPPKPKSLKDTKIVKDESKENQVKGERNTKAVNDKEHDKDNEVPPEVTMPSFWAKRNMFLPDTKSSTNAPKSPEKTKPKESTKPIINLKTDSCAVCGAKVYQMEKFKVKDNVVHRSCIKCSVCKRLLSVGNFIMSKNKIYCKPHEPPITISLSS